MLFAALAASSVLADEHAADRKLLESTRDTLGKWVEAEQILSEEKRDWAYGQEVLEQRIAIVESQVSQVEGRIAEARAGIEETAKKRRELIAEEKILKKASRALSDGIPDLERKTLALVELLPASVRDRLSPLVQRIPEDPAKSKQFLSQRYQNVIGILNEVNKFNQNITVISEVRTLSDGKMAEVKTVYVGLGLAYFATPDGKRAGIGVPTGKGWAWEPSDSFAPQVLKVIAILNSEQVPEYVPLPAKIH